ncbi:hypothetical protein FRB96_003117 [Tulasnella sp. 330]|nr:hypothetical protein FRB96_003117 [Tulasnella sp. 330]
MVGHWKGSPPALLSSTSPKPECPQTPPGNSSPNESVSAVIATRLNRWHAAELLAMWNTNPVIPSPEVRSGWAREKGLKARQVYTWFKSHETRSPDARVAYAKSVFKWVKQAEASEESIRLEPELEIVPHLWYLPVSNAHDEPPPPTTNIYDPFCCVEWNSPHPDAQTAEFTYDILSSELPVQNETVDSSPSPYHPESWVNDDSGGNRGFEMPMRLLPLRETGSGAGIEGRGWRSERLQTFNRLMELNKELGL